jgi:hypothetical protein
MYEKAIALDPNFIESYIGLAHLWDIMGWWGFYESRAAIANSRKFMEKVLEMDPENELIENQLYAGLWWFEWDFEKVETYFQKRLADGSLHQSTQMIFYALDTERIEEGYDAVEKALMESPNEAKLYAIKGLALYQLNKKQEVFKLMEDAGPLYGDNWLYNMRSAKLYYLLGHYDKSRHLIPLTSEESLEDEDSEVLFFNALFHNMDQPGSKENRFLNALILKFDKSANGSPAWTLANYYCVNGDYDKSFYWLQKSYDHHEVDLTSLYGEPFLEPLKQDPRFKELCNKVGLSKVVLR